MSPMATSKTMLVLGANAGQADLIRYMQSCGWRVLACAKTRGQPGEFAADAFYHFDVKDTEAALEVIRRESVDLVYSAGSDVTNAQCIRLSEIAGLPHFYSSGMIKLFDNKHELRAILNEAGISKVGHRLVRGTSDLSDWTTFPAFIKPDASQGQRGVAKVSTPLELHRAVEEAVLAGGPGSAAIVEEYLDGVEVSANVLVKDSEVVFCAIHERVRYGDHHIGLASAHIFPAYSATEEQLMAARRLVDDIVRLLSIQNGPLYVQMMLTREGPKLIEIGPRIDGGHLWRLFLHATGLNFIDLTMRLLAGEDTKTEHEPPQRFGLAFYRMPTGVQFEAARHSVPAAAVYSEFRYGNGELVQPTNGSYEVVGYFVQPLTEPEAKSWVENGRHDPTGQS